MIAGKQYHGPAADTWSLGVILFALVCGHLPFEDPNTSNLYRKILSGEYKTPKWISPEVKDLIRKILETDPEKRLTISQIRLHPWCQLVPVQSIPKEEPNPDEIEETKNEVFKRLEEVGLDVQSVLDAVSSHACNSLSAMYYLLMQKEQLKLRLSKKFSTNSARPETSDRNLLSGIQGVGARSLEKVNDPLDIQAAQQSPIIQEGEVVVIKQSPKVADPIKKIPPVVAPVKQQIPKLNIKPAVQNGASNPLVSQSAREGNSTHPRGQLAAILNPPPGTHTSGAATARPVLEDAVPVEPPVHESSPKRGVIIRGSTIDNAAHDGNHTRDAGADLTIVANGLVQLPPVEAERPTTRRSKSRGAKAPEGGLSPEYQTDGPGMGKIPSAEAFVAVETKQISKEPLAPREPPKSGGATGGRRGKHLIPTSQTQATEEQVSQTPANLVPTPPNKPKPSAVTTLTDPRTIYQGRQGIGAKSIQPIARDPTTPRAPSAPTTKPPEVSARALAQKNKQSQQVGSISLGMEHQLHQQQQPTTSVGTSESPTAVLSLSPPSVLVT